MPLGRPIKLRISYLNDAGYLNRLAQAIEVDQVRNKAWRERALELLRQLVAHLSEPTAE